MKKAALGFALIVIAVVLLAAMPDVSSEGSQASYQQFKGDVISYDSEARELKIRAKVGDRWDEKTFELTKNAEIFRYMLGPGAQADEEVEMYVRLALEDLKEEISVTVLYRVQEGRNWALSIELHS